MSEPKRFLIREAISIFFKQWVRNYDDDEIEEKTNSASIIR